MTAKAEAKKERKRKQLTPPTSSNGSGSSGSSSSSESGQTFQSTELTQAMLERARGRPRKQSRKPSRLSHASGRTQQAPRQRSEMPRFRFSDGASSANDNGLTTDTSYEHVNVCSCKRPTCMRSRLKFVACNFSSPRTLISLPLPRYRKPKKQSERQHTYLQDQTNLPSVSS